MFSTNVTQAYTQSKEKLQQNMCVNYFKESGPNDDKFLIISEPPYGLLESGD